MMSQMTDPVYGVIGIQGFPEAEPSAENCPGASAAFKTMRGNTDAVFNALVDKPYRQVHPVRCGWEGIVYGDMEKAETGRFMLPAVEVIFGEAQDGADAGLF